MGRRRNLVLVSNPAINGRSDFEAIAAKVHELDPGIAAHVIDHVEEWTPAARLRHHLRRVRLATRPTLVVAPHRHDGFSPLRGVLRSGSRMSKADEAERLRRGGIPIPRQVEWTEHDHPAIDHLGEYVVVKPARGTQGEDVTLMRADEVEWRSFDGALVGESTTMVVQEFIDTDPAPSYVRVLTFFGAAVYCELNSLEVDQRTTDRGEDPRTWRICPRGDDRWREMIDDREAVELAGRAAALFDEIPLCGVDVVRSVDTGELYVLEMNTWGYVWHLSSPPAAATRERYGVDLYGQYGALDVSAESLVRKTRELLG